MSLPAAFCADELLAKMEAATRTELMIFCREFNRFIEKRVYETSCAD